MEERAVNVRKRLLTCAASGLQIVAMLTLLLATATGAAAAPTIEEAAPNGIWSLGVSASSYPSSEDAEAYTNSAGFTFGARFVVTSEAGDYIGECTLEHVPDPTNWHNCRVDVPSDRVSLVWEDVESLPPGFAPIENPITFDPTVFQTGPHNVHAWFVNAPAEGSAEADQSPPVKSMSIMPVGPEGSVLGVGFTVTTQDGAMLGSCTVAPDFPEGYIPNCAVDVPLNTTVAVWFDPAASTADMVPVENPVYFDTSTEDNAQMWGPAFEFVPAGETASSDDASSGDSSSQPGSAPDTDVFSLLPVIEDVPDGLVETGRQTRSLADVAANYTDVAETTQLFTQWGWEQNAIASFALPANHEAQSGEANGVYVSIHRFSDADGCRAALDFSVTEQAAGTSLQEIDTRHFGDYTRALFGAMEYGNETTLLTQQDGLLIRVSVSMLDGDPTADAESIMQGVTERALGGNTASGTDAQDGSQGQNTQVIVPTDNAQGTSSRSGDTWTASVQVTNCDAARTNCTAASGIVINISLASGEFLGSCTLGEPEMSPGGVPISVCGVPGLPYNADFVATQDPATIPAGYEPLEASLTLHVDDMHPGGGDQPTFGFTNVRTDTGSTASTGASRGDTSGEATLLMTFRGCPEGFDPATDDFFATCTIPLDAPDNAFLYHGGDGQGGMNIAWLDRQDNGAYIFNAVPLTMNLELYGLAPVVRDSYQVMGADSGDGSTFTVNLVDGEIREIFVFYYYG
jgi:hypothetical protein